MAQLWATGLWAPGLWAAGLWEGGIGSLGVEHVAILVQPAGAVIGFSLTTQPVVKLVDEFGATVTSYAGRFKAILVGGTAQIIGDTVYAVAGIGTYTTLRLDGSGPQLIALVAIDRPATPGVTANVLNMAQAPGGTNFRNGGVHANRSVRRGHGHR